MPVTRTKQDFEAVISHDTPEQIRGGMHAAIERAADDHGFETGEGYAAAYLLAAGGHDAEGVLEYISPTLDLAEFAHVDPEAAAEYVTAVGAVFNRSAGYVNTWTKHHLEETHLSGEYLSTVSSVAPVVEPDGASLVDLLFRVASMAEQGHRPQDARRELIAHHKAALRGGDSQ